MGARVQFTCDDEHCTESCSFTLLALVADSIQALNRLRSEGWYFRPHQRESRLVAWCPKHAREERFRSAPLRKGYAGL